MTAARSTRLRGRYDAVNIKLDKTGGLTEALAMADAAQALGFEIMVGCMVATSLADGAGDAARAAGAASSISTARCCWRAIAITGCATTAAWSIRRTPRCGDDPSSRCRADQITKRAGRRHRRHHVIEALPVMRA